MAVYLRIGIADLVEHAQDDDTGRRPLPIIGINVQSDRDVAHGLGDLDGNNLVASCWIRIP
jgi:hypothetical protein